MKKFFFATAIILFGVFSYSQFPQVKSFFYFSPCDKPISYRVDEIDPRFKIPRKVLLFNIEKASDVWNRVYGKNLFVYDPQGSLSINLVYDKRQYLTTQINEMEGQLETDKESISLKIQEYENQAAIFKQDLEKLKSEISEWNKKGGAPADVYEKLTKKQQELKTEADRLNNLSRGLNISTDSYNSQVAELNTTVQSFNKTLQMKPEEGVYNPKENKIEIYFLTNKNELIHTLAHELGHALELSHNQSRESIMYPYTTQKITSSLEDVVELKNTCRKRSIFEPIASRLYAIVGFKLASILVK